jgi:hypothetical protein
VVQEQYHVLAQAGFFKELPEYQAKQCKDGNDDDYCPYHSIHRVFLIAYAYDKGICDQLQQQQSNGDIDISQFSQVAHACLLP